MHGRPGVGGVLWGGREWVEGVPEFVAGGALCWCGGGCGGGCPVWWRSVLAAVVRGSLCAAGLAERLPPCCE